MYLGNLTHLHRHFSGIFLRHHPYSVYGRGAWLVYLATDISAMGDTVPLPAEIPMGNFSLRLRNTLVITDAYLAKEAKRLKLFGITYLVGKIKFIFFFQGPLAE